MKCLPITPSPFGGTNWECLVNSSVVDVVYKDENAIVVCTKHGSFVVNDNNEIGINMGLDALKNYLEQSIKNN